MPETKPCIACAEEIKVEARLCKHCQTAQDDPRWEKPEALDENFVVLSPSERRVPQDSMTAEQYDLMESVTVEVGSDEHQNSLVPFDMSKPPGKGDLVPGDCVWAIYPYPGPLPQSLLQGSWGGTNPMKFFGNLGDVRGWTYSDFLRGAGTPFTTMPQPNGHQTVVWSHGGLLQAWSAAFYFDSYGVCYGIGNETQF